MQNQKKVVHLTTVHHPYDPRIYHKECQSLQRAGFDVTLIAQEGSADDQEKLVNHIPVKKYKSRMKRMFFGAMDAYKKAKRIKADVYHFHDPELLPVGWLLKKKNNIVIYDIHEDYVTSILQKNYMNPFLRKLIAKIYKVMEKLFLNKMELCLAEKYYKDIYPTGKCILNYPMVNKRFMEHKREKAPLEPKLLYTGNVTYDRGALIHARIPLIDNRYSVHFVGKCAGTIAEEMYESAGKEKSNITIEGIDRFVEKEDIEKQYLSRNWLAGVALFPPTEHYMKKELTKFFEYMNAGLPVICSNFPVWERFMEKYQCGIAVDPYNDKEIHQAIEYLKENPEITKQMGENGKNAVKNELNWRSEEKKLIAWYNQLLGQS